LQLKLAVCFANRVTAVYTPQLLLFWKLAPITQLLYSFPFSFTITCRIRCWLYIGL